MICRLLSTLPQRKSARHSFHSRIARLQPCNAFLRRTGGTTPPVLPLSEDRLPEAQVPVAPVADALLHRDTAPRIGLRTFAPHPAP